RAVVTKHARTKLRHDKVDVTVAVEVDRSTRLVGARVVEHLRHRRRRLRAAEEATMHDEVTLPRSDEEDGGAARCVTRGSDRTPEVGAEPSAAVLARQGRRERMG